MVLQAVENLEVGEQRMMESIERLHDLAWGGEITQLFSRLSFDRDSEEKCLPEIATSETVPVLKWLSTTGKTPMLLH